MSATTVSNIVSAMEALMGQVKELQAAKAAAEAASPAFALWAAAVQRVLVTALVEQVAPEKVQFLSTLTPFHVHPGVAEAQALVAQVRGLRATTADDVHDRVWNVVRGVDRYAQGIPLDEAVEKMAAELIKLRQQVAAAAAPAVGSSAAPSAPAGAVAELKAAVEAEKKRREANAAKFLEELPEELKKMVAARLLAKEVVGLTLPYYTKENAAAAVAVLTSLGLVAEVDASDYCHVKVTKEQMERLKREVMK
jgi:hypothetical protein